MDDRLHVCSVRLVCALFILHSLKQLPFHMLRHHAAPIGTLVGAAPGQTSREKVSWEISKYVLWYLLVI